MNWIVYLLVGLSIWSITAVIDKYILKRVKSRILYVFAVGIAYFISTSIILFFKGFIAPPNLIMFLAFFIGVSEAAALYYFFTAVSLDEVSKVIPLGSMTSFVVLLGSWLILKDPLQGAKLGSFAFFIAGGFLLAFNYSKKKITASKALKPILIAGFLNSIWYVGMKHVFNNSDLLSGVYFSVIGILVGGFALLHLDNNVPKIWKTMGLKLKCIMFGNQFLAFIGYIFIMVALSLENAALVSSAFGIQYALTFIFATIATHINPDLVGENLAKDHLLRKTAGIFLIILAVYLVNS